MYLLDSDVLIDVQRKFAPAVAWLNTLSDPPLVPGFVVMELIQNAQNNQQVQAAVALTATLTIVWPTHADCERALEFFTKYHLSHNLGLVDSLIAACAIGLSATLCTFNLRHYRVVPGLITAQPYAR
jgi:predicted nucleic acid-binding protein